MVNKHNFRLIWVDGWRAGEQILALDRQRGANMGDFFIGKTNFGVDAKKSRFDFKKASDSRLLLTIEVHGDPKVYKEVTADEDSEWSWTLYPPHFYLRDYPVSEKTKSKERQITLKPEDSDNFEVALYLMEHNDVEGVRIKVDDHRLEISGQVDLMGEPREFRIRWEK